MSLHGKEPYQVSDAYVGRRGDILNKTVGKDLIPTKNRRVKIKRVPVSSTYPLTADIRALLNELLIRIEQSDMSDRQRMNIEEVLDEVDVLMYELEENVREYARGSMQNIQEFQQFLHKMKFSVLNTMSKEFNNASATSEATLKHTINQSNGRVVTTRKIDEDNIPFVPAESPMVGQELRRDVVPSADNLEKVKGETPIKQQYKKAYDVSPQDIVHVPEDKASVVPFKSVSPNEVEDRPEIISILDAITQTDELPRARHHPSASMETYGNQKESLDNHGEKVYTPKTYEDEVMDVLNAAKKRSERWKSNKK